MYESVWRIKTSKILLNIWHKNKTFWQFNMLAILIDEDNTNGSDIGTQSPQIVVCIKYGASMWYVLSNYCLSTTFQLFWYLRLTSTTKLYYLSVWLIPFVIYIEKYEKFSSGKVHLVIMSIDRFCWKLKGGEYLIHVNNEYILFTHQQILF